MERIKEAVERAKISRQMAIQDASQSAAQAATPATASTVENGCYANLKSIPLNRRYLEGMRIVSFDSTDPWSASFDMLRTQVLRQMDDHGWQTLAVTSPSGGCGKTLVAINLALSIAREPAHSSVLVDFDLRKPQVAKYLGLTDGHDLGDLLAGHASLAEVLIRPELGNNGLIVLQNQVAISGSSEIIKSTETRHLVQQLRGAQRSRIIIFDLPPVLAADDVLAFLPHVDCVLLVAAAGSSTVAEIEESEQHLSSANLLGVVLNKSRESNKAYY